MEDLKEILRKKLPDDAYEEEEIKDNNIDLELEKFIEKRKTKEDKIKEKERKVEDSYFSDLQDVLREKLSNYNLESEEEFKEDDIDLELEEFKAQRRVKEEKEKNKKKNNIEDSYFSDLRQVIEEKLAETKIEQEEEETKEEDIEEFIINNFSKDKEEQEKEKNIDEQYSEDLHEVIEEKLSENTLNDTDKESDELDNIEDQIIEAEILEKKIEQETLNSTYNDELEEVIEEKIPENNENINVEPIIENNKIDETVPIKKESANTEKIISAKVIESTIEIPRSFEEDLDEIRVKYSHAFKNKRTKNKKRIILKKRKFNKKNIINNFKEKLSKKLSEYKNNILSLKQDKNKLSFSDISFGFDKYLKNSSVENTKKQVQKPKKEQKQKPIKINYNIENVDENDIDLGIELNDTEEDKKRKIERINSIDRLKLKLAAFGISATLVVGSLITGMGGIFKNKKQTPKKPATTISHMEEETTKEPTIIDISKGKNFSDLTNLSTTATNAQRDQMLNMSLFLTLYNGSFANKTETSKYRVALRWDELAALKLAFNKYSEEEIKEIFNGEKLKQETLKKDYDKAAKQLTKAFIKDNRNYPVSLDVIIDSPKAKKKYYKLYEYFENAKRTSGITKHENIKKFYKEAYKAMFNKDKKIQYKNIHLFIKPMVNAADKLFDDEKVNKKLVKKVNKYYNSNKLSNNLISKYTTIENILKNGPVNEKIPLYSQFRHAKVKELKENNWYNIENRNIDTKIKKENDDAKDYNYSNYDEVNNIRYASKNEDNKKEQAPKAAKVVKSKHDEENITKKNKRQQKQPSITTDNKEKTVVKVAPQERNYVSSTETEEETTTISSQNNNYNMTNEDIANSIVEDMTNDTYSVEEYEQEYQYTYTR